MAVLNRIQLAARQPAVTGNITANGQSITATDLTGVGSATVSISGTYAGVILNFEASLDGTNWATIPALQLGSAAPASVLTTGTLTNNTILYNVSPLLGVQQLRVRASGYTSGTAAIRIHLSAQFTNPIVTVASAPTTAVSGTVSANLQTQANVGSLMHYAISTAGTMSQLVKSGATGLYGVELFNSGATPAYIKFYNQNTAPTVGTGTPVKTMMIPAGGGVALAKTFNSRFATGLAYTVTGGMAHTDTTALALNQVTVSIDYA